jgi:GTPase SAR1 family protein
MGVVSSLHINNLLVGFFFFRYRSITKQYFRKADGVIMMYDVTTEATFTNVRNWVTSVKEGVEEGTAMVVVGNKTDLIEEQDRRAVKTKDGKHLAAVRASHFVTALYKFTVYTRL